MYDSHGRYIRKVTSVVEHMSRIGRSVLLTVRKYVQDPEQRTYSQMGNYLHIGSKLHREHRLCRKREIHRLTIRAHIRQRCHPGPVIRGVGLDSIAHMSILPREMQHDILCARLVVQEKHIPQRFIISLCRAHSSQRLNSGGQLRSNVVPD